MLLSPFCGETLEAPVVDGRNFDVSASLNIFSIYFFLFFFLLTFSMARA